MNLIKNQLKSLITHSLGNQIIQSVTNCPFKYGGKSRKDWIQQMCTVSLGSFRNSGHTTAAFEIQKEFNKFKCVTVFPNKAFHDKAMKEYEKVYGVDPNSFCVSVDLSNVKNFDINCDIIIFDCAGMKNCSDIIDYIIDQRINLNDPGVLVLLQPKII